MWDGLYGQVEVRRVQPYDANKVYICPGCNQDIPVGMGHYVCVPAEAVDLRVTGITRAGITVYLKRVRQHLKLHTRDGGNIKPRAANARMQRRIMCAQVLYKIKRGTTHL